MNNLQQIDVLLHNLAKQKPKYYLQKICKYYIICRRMNLTALLIGQSQQFRGVLATSLDKVQALYTVARGVRATHSAESAVGAKRKDNNTGCCW